MIVQQSAGSPIDLYISLSHFVLFRPSYRFYQTQTKRYVYLKSYAFYLLKKIIEVQSGVFQENILSAILFTPLKVFTAPQCSRIKIIIRLWGEEEEKGHWTGAPPFLAKLPLLAAAAPLLLVTLVEVRQPVIFSAAAPQ